MIPNAKWIRPAQTTGDVCPVYSKQFSFFLLPISRYLLLRTQHFLLQQWEFMKHL